MLFYTAIFLVCLALGLLLPWLFRVLSGNRDLVEQTTRPRSKIQSTSHLSPHAKRATMRDPWASELALAGANHAQARQDMGDGGSFYDPCKDYFVPHQAKMLLKHTDRTSRQERRVVETATYRVSREIRVSKNNSKSVVKPTMIS